MTKKQFMKKYVIGRTPDVWVHNIEMIVSLLKPGATWAWPNANLVIKCVGDNTYSVTKMF
jgi:hypothetical protein